MYANGTTVKTPVARTEVARANDRAASQYLRVVVRYRPQKMNIA